MQRGKTGHGGPKRAGPDHMNAALVRLLIADALAQSSAEHRGGSPLVLPGVDDGADRRRHSGKVDLTRKRGLAVS
jgi:hypothetical protein